QIIYRPASLHRNRLLRISSLYLNGRTHLAIHLDIAGKLRPGVLEQIDQGLSGRPIRDQPQITFGERLAVQQDSGSTAFRLNIAAADRTTAIEIFYFPTRRIVLGRTVRRKA